MSLHWVDAHTHLNMLETNIEETLNNSEKVGVKQVITIGTQWNDFDFVTTSVHDFFPRVHGTLGVHPHDAKTFDTKTEEYLFKQAPSPGIVAIGEIGLDYYYKQSPIDTQKTVFQRQLDIAADLDLPVEIHTRDAEEDTIEILSNYKGKVTGLLHCFTGSQWLADEALKLGFNISISGVVTFKNASPLRDVVRSLPLDRIHVETDAPFLAPVPMRGKKNEPAFVIHTAEKVAELKEISILELQKQCKRNLLNLFPKFQWLS